MQVNGPDQIVSRSEKAVNAEIDTWIRTQHSCLMVYFCHQENFVKTIGKVNIHVLLLTLHDREVCYYHFQLLLDGNQCSIERDSSIIFFCFFKGIGK